MRAPDLRSGSAIASRKAVREGSSGGKAQRAPVSAPCSPAGLTYLATLKFLGLNRCEAENSGVENSG